MSCASWALVGKIAAGIVIAAASFALVAWLFLRQTVESRD